MDKLKTSPPPSRPQSPSVLSSSSLPTPTPNRSSNNRGSSASSANAKRYRYLRRLLKFRQMDFEFAFWQMWYLFTAPQKVYRNFQYRKQTKDQFARDDPAFLVLLSFSLFASSVGFALILKLNFFEFLILTSYVIFIDCIGVGLLIATVFWFLTNKYLRKPTCRDQDVEWGYAFDVHLNAFFPLLIILHVFQIMFYYVLLDSEWFLSQLFGNGLWFIALSYYIYITFLGYSCLPILRNTQVLLYPMMLLVLFYIFSLAYGWNISHSFMYFYKYRVR